jgi:hypothetical protein
MRFTDFKITEAILGASSPSSVPGYLEKVNQILATPGATIEMGPNGGNVFQPNPGQTVTDLNSVIQGKGKNHLGKDVTSVVAKTIFKGAITGAAAADKGKVDFNRGEVAEGWHALAAFVRLIARPSRDITIEDVKKYIPNIENGKTYKLPVSDVENKELSDEFHVTISLKPKQWSAFKQPDEVLKDREMSKIVSDIVLDANSETGRRADVYATNGKYDLVRVIGDGVSGETETKTDINFENETEKKFRGYSIKAGTTSQIHQVGGGAVKDSTKGKKATPETRYNILQNELFGVHGRARIADISKAKENYLEAAQDESVPGRLHAQEIAYRAAVSNINQRLQGDDEEKTFVRTLAVALKYFQSRDDDTILLKQFTGKGVYILDPKRFDKLHEMGLDLVAQYVDTKANPELEILDAKSNKTLITFRTYKSSSGYMRNYIEKGPLFVELTNLNKKEAAE